MPVVKTEQGISVPLEVMAGLWEQITRENKADDLFYDQTVTNLQEWIAYIYHPNNHVVLVIDETGHVYHIAWLNRYSRGNAYCHHVSLGNYRRRTWPTLVNYWRQLNAEGKPLVNIILGITPVTNEKAIKLLKMLKFNVLGEIPGLCYNAKEKKNVPGLISFFVINEVT